MTFQDGGQLLLDSRGDVVPFVPVYSGSPVKYHQSLHLKLDSLRMRRVLGDVGLQSRIWSWAQLQRNLTTTDPQGVTDCSEEPHETPGTVGRGGMVCNHCTDSAGTGEWLLSRIWSSTTTVQILTTVTTSWESEVALQRQKQNCSTMRSLYCGEISVHCMGWPLLFIMAGKVH